ncbi:MAG: prephenate dehydrogenase/arogenate dehydrogenase family protein [Acidobacteria bacterium]|nr:prephenate dehydrogenase/arogenate dehydrogenase family protein [Acidobacteriota bacterium]
MAFERIAILGVGLIGGSFALALRQRGSSAELVGWDRPEVLAQAEQGGAIQRGTTELDEAIRGAQLVYIATPVVLTLELLPQILRQVGPGTLVTDTGSTKAAICRIAREAGAPEVLFLGGHPMAGKEKQGIENADPDLFVGATYILTPDEPETMNAPTAQALLELLRSIGAQPEVLDAETHDWAVALVSHLPQLLSTALASVVWDETDEDGLPIRLAGPGFADMTRLAASPYELWRDIGLTNSENIVRTLERLEQRLERLRSRLQSRELEEEFRKAREIHQRLAALQAERRRQ